MKWTDDRVEMLRTLWIEGLTASQIADRLGGTTRNAVIGKAHRLGLRGRDAKATAGGGVTAPEEAEACTSALEADIVSTLGDEPETAAEEHAEGEHAEVAHTDVEHAEVEHAEVAHAEADTALSDETVGEAVDAATTPDPQSEPETGGLSGAPEGAPSGAAEDDGTDGDDKIDPTNEETETDVQQTELETANDEAMTAAAIAAEVEKNARRLSLLELTERTCKWPIGDPSTDDFFFCGHRCSAEKPYCEAHSAIAYQPMSSRRDRERHRTRARALSA